MSLFITGTDTDVGKTLVSAWLVHHWRASYWKPIQSGPLADSGTVHNLVPSAKILPSRWTLSQPLSPHLAARHDGIQLDLADFVLPEVQGPLVVEGAGGVLVPINDRHLMIDLMAQLGLPVLVVARSTLGTINHTILTLRALRQRGLTILGVVMNGPPDPDNAQAIGQYGQVDVLAQIPHLPVVTSETLAAVPCPIPPL